jgi:predicted dehydrogenase
MWLGQTPRVPYIKERCHYTFRWWYEYSGGQMTDWGAHHIDIAQWAMGLQSSGPVEIDGKAEFPGIPDGYNVATTFQARLVYPGGIEMLVADRGEIGITFEGDKGSIFVSRADLRGKAVDELKEIPLPREAFKLYPYDNLERPPRVQKKEATMNHMGNFFDCIRTRNKPIADVASQHRSVTACHVANISMRLGRKLRWDPEKEIFVADEEANRWLSREQRKPYAVEG